MSKTLHLRPAPGLTIPDPATGRHLPVYGDSVDDSPYWRRRLREGSVEQSTPTFITAAQNAAATPADAVGPAQATAKKGTNKP